MSTELNKIFCGTDAKNTGICDCFLDPKLVTGAILAPLGKVFTAAEILAIQATLEALVEAPKATRIFPIQNFVAVTDNTEDPTNQTFGYGAIEPVREGSYNWVFGFRKGGVNLSNALRSFNGLTGKYGVLFIESENILFGTKKKDINGADGLAPVPLEVLYTFPWKVNDGANLAGYRIQFSFRPEYINESIAFAKVAKTEYLLTELVGLQDIVLSIDSADDVTDVVVITGTTDCGSSNLYDLYATELAQTGAWVVKNAAGVAIAVTVTQNAAAEGWNLTYDTAEVTDGDTITLAAPATLAAPPINISGYEANTVTVALGS